MAEITKWVKKIWKNRTTEFPTRRTLMKEDGSSEIVTVTRNEGTVSEEGDAFDADTMNNLEERIDAGFAELNGKLNRFGNLNVKSTNDGTLPNIIQKNGFYLIVAKRWTVADAGIVCLCDWVDGSEPYIYIVQKSDTFRIATNSDGTITAMFNGYTSGVYLTVMRLY